MSGVRRLYAFSPITTKAKFDDALVYIVRRLTQLSEELTGTRLKLENAKVFAHYPDEFEFLKQIIAGYGEPAAMGRATSMYVKTDLHIEGSYLRQIGIRIPDPYRMQVGCGDYEVDNKSALISTLAPDARGFVRPFPDLPQQFIELWHPNFDVAGYIKLPSESGHFGQGSAVRPVPL
jgi:hypothetical protein